MYWNGKLIGQFFKVPPHPSWYYSYYPHSLPLIGSAVGVLADRVLEVPLDTCSQAESGGLYDSPLVHEQIRLRCARPQSTGTTCGKSSLTTL